MELKKHITGVRIGAFIFGFIAGWFVLCRLFPATVTMPAIASGGAAGPADGTGNTSSDNTDNSGLDNSGLDNNYGSSSDGSGGGGGGGGSSYLPDLSQSSSPTGTSSSPNDLTGSSSLPVMANNTSDGNNAGSGNSGGSGNGLSPVFPKTIGMSGQNNSANNSNPLLAGRTRMLAIHPLTLTTLPAMANNLPAKNSGSGKKVKLIKGISKITTNNINH